MNLLQFCAFTSLSIPYFYGEDSDAHTEIPVIITQGSCDSLIVQMWRKRGKRGDRDHKSFFLVRTPSKI